jgi:hypothetical protein
MRACLDHTNDLEQANLAQRPMRIPVRPIVEDGWIEPCMYAHSIRRVCGFGYVDVWWWQDTGNSWLKTERANRLDNPVSPCERHAATTESYVILALLNT